MINTAFIILQLVALFFAVLAGIFGEYDRALFNMAWAILLELRFIKVGAS